MKNLLRTFCVVTPLAVLISCGPSNQTENDSTTSSRDTIPAVVSIKGEEVGYNTDTVEMKGYITYDSNDSTRRAGILVVHEWWGHTDYVRQRADMLAELGYVALAVDMYGDGQKADHPEDAMKFSGMVMNNMEGSRARFQAAYNVLAAHPMVEPGSVSAVGYCFGGSLILAFANDGMDLDGVAAFHSGVELPIMPGNSLTSRVLVQNGGADPFISEESVTAFKSAMDDAGATYEYISYPGVKHAFTNPAADEKGQQFELPLAYDKEADEKSWMKLQEFLDGIYPE